MLTGGFSFQSDGDTPRTRLQDNSNAQLIKVSQRKAAAEKLNVINPTKVMTEKLTAQFAPKVDGSDALEISVESVAWHLYYDKFESEVQTYFLEYASDIKLSLSSASLNRSFECDKQSQTSLTQANWVANNNQKIQGFVNSTVDKCISQILQETGKSQ